jgi:hypothetical protein
LLESWKAGKLSRWIEAISDLRVYWIWDSSFTTEASERSRGDVGVMLLAISLQDSEVGARHDLFPRLVWPVHATYLWKANFRIAHHTTQFMTAERFRIPFRTLMMRLYCRRFSMKRLFTLFTLLMSVVAFAGSSSTPGPDRIWITDVIVISPENLDHIEKGSVLIEDGRIVRVDRTQKAKIPDGAIVVSGNGQYLIPGLMDSHVHLASIPGIGMIPDQVQLNQPLAKSYFKHEALVESYLKQMPRSYLYYGYTTLVDLVAPFPQALNDFRHEPLHPDLYDCNPSMPFANGYPMSYAPPEVRFKLFPNFI